MNMQNPTAVGISGRSRIEQDATSRFSSAGVRPAGIGLSRNGIGMLHKVALFEKGLTTPVQSSVYAAAASRSRKPSNTSVSLLSKSTSSWPAARIPAFAVATNPRLTGFSSRRMRGS